MNQELLNITNILLHKNTDGIPLTSDEMAIAQKYYTAEKINNIGMSRSATNPSYCSLIKPLQETYPCPIINLNSV